MPFKARSASSTSGVVDRWDSGAGWIAHPEETMQRASHLLRGDDGSVWVVEPVDAPALEDLCEEFGDPDGVVVLVDRHARDADAVARRYDVPVYRPPFVDRSFAAPVREFEGALADSGFDLHRVVNLPGWREGALFDGETLVAGDALGTAGYFRAPGEVLGVHPALRVLPPRAFDAFAPDRVLVGHGEGVAEDAATALQAAVGGARRRLPAAWLSAFWHTVRAPL